MSDRDPEATCASILQEALDVIESKSLKARAEGTNGPAVLVLDPRDAFARTIAQLKATGDEIAACISTARRLGASPVLTWCVTRPMARRFVAEACTEAAAAIDRAEPGDGHLAVVIAEGGVSVFTPRRLTDR